jgi:hypothetical protein
MLDGKKVTESRYLGRVDPVTNELLSKIPGKTKTDREKTAKETDSFNIHKVITY